MTKIIFQKQYDGESLFDLERDILECINEEYNDELEELPKDEHGFQKGIFTATIEWSEDE